MQFTLCAASPNKKFIFFQIFSSFPLCVVKYAANLQHPPILFFIDKVIHAPSLCQMSWLDTPTWASLAKTAKTAVKYAQKNIDKVLEIPDAVTEEKEALSDGSIGSSKETNGGKRSETPTLIKGTIRTRKWNQIRSCVRLIDRLIDWFFEWLVGWLVGRLIDWLIDWLIDFIITLVPIGLGCCWNADLFLSLLFRRNRRIFSRFSEWPIHHPHFLHPKTPLHPSSNWIVPVHA